MATAKPKKQLSTMDWLACLGVPVEDRRASEVNQDVASQAPAVVEHHKVKGIFKGRSGSRIATAAPCISCLPVRVTARRLVTVRAGCAMWLSAVI